MNKMNRSISLLLMTLVSFALFAAPRSEKEAREIAYKHFMAREAVSARGQNGLSNVEMTLVGTSSSILGADFKARSQSPVSTAEAMYIYNYGTEAFVIISGDDAAETILAYSDDSAFGTENLPTNIKGWMQSYADQIDYAMANPARAFDKAEVQDSKYPASIQPILKSDGNIIQWDQNAPFNAECPLFQNYRCPVGCVATALGQIVYYHRYPAKGQGGIKNYISLPYNISQSFDFSGSEFDYSLMLPKYVHGGYTQEQGDEVAKLCHGLGVAVDMQYEPVGSGAYSMDIGNAMVKYFGYDKNIHYVMRDYFTQQEWQDMIKEELVNGRPICYAGNSANIGHQFVFDGYDQNNMVHINWGWAGMSDGYFRLNALAPSALGTGGGTASSGGFIFGQAMWLGMQAPNASSTPQSFFVVNKDNVYINKKQVIPGEIVTLSAKNYYNLSVDFKGELGVILESTDGVQTLISTAQNVELKTGTGRGSETGYVLSQEATIPNDITDGEYKIYYATRMSEELSWSRVRTANGYNDLFTLNVQGSSASITEVVTEPDCTGSVQEEHNLYPRISCSFSSKIRNVGTSEFFGLAHIAIFKVENGQNVIYGLCGNQQLSLPVGEEVDARFVGSLEAVEGKTITRGEYKACVVVEFKDKYYPVTDARDITINRLPSGMASIQVSDLVVSQQSIAMDENLEGSFTATNKQSVYSDYIGIVIFKEGSNTGTSCWDAEAFLEAGSSKDFVFSIPNQWEPGKYKASIRYNSGYTNVAEEFTFEVRDEFTGITSVDEAQGTVQYYSLSGKRLMSEPSNGIYIIRKNTANGVVTSKVVK